MLKLSRRLFSTALKTSSFEVTCSVYDIKEKTYKSSKKCLYKDIINEHPTCYFIRNFPDELTIKDAHSELTLYHITKPVYGSELYNTLWSFGDDLKASSEEKSPLYSVHLHPKSLTIPERNTNMEQVYKLAKELELRDCLSFIFLTEQQNNEIA
jgi:hypothetical protein